MIPIFFMSSSLPRIRGAMHRRRVYGRNGSGGKRGGAARRGTSRFIAKCFMAGKSLKRDFLHHWCTRKLSKVVDPLDNQRFHILLLLHPLSLPSGPLLHGPGGFFVVVGKSPGDGTSVPSPGLDGEAHKNVQFCSGSAAVSSGSLSTSILSIMLPSMSTTSKRHPCQIT